MQTNWTKISLLLFPLAGVLWRAPLVAAYDDNPGDEREERQPAAARMSERDLQKFDAFLDAHDETAQELYRDPNLVKNERFLRGHADLSDWLDNYPEAAAAIQADPRAAIWHERTTERGEREERRPAATQVSERDLSSFEDYLNTHDETAQLLYQDPELINDRRFVRNHDALHDWLEAHPDAAAAIQANPQQYLWRERTRSPQDFLRQLLK